MRWDGRTAAGLLIAVAVLALAVLASAVDVPWEVRERSLGLDAGEPQLRQPIDPPEPEGEPPDLPEPVDLGWVPWAVAAVVTVAGLLALGWLARWWRDRPVARRPVRVDAPDPPDEPDLPVLQRGVAEAQRFLRDVAAADDAIIAAWLALEEAAAASGVRRHPAQTPTEFTVQVLERTEADPEATRSLLALYHRARFSDQPLHPDDVDQAAVAFGRIAASWDALTPDPQGPRGGS